MDEITQEVINASRAAMDRGGPVSREAYRAAFRLALRALQHKETEIARLKTELARYEGREIKYGLERYLQSNISDGTMPDCRLGTIAHATDTGAEWELTESGWQVRERYVGKHE